MIKFKMYNEYRDRLCDPLISGYMKALGCDIYSPECWIINEEIQEQELDHVIDDFTGMNPEGYKFHSYRYTNTFVQTWLRDNYNIHIFIGWRPNVKKWDSHFYSLDLNGEEYTKKRNMKAFQEDELFDTYEEALESGIKSALLEILKEKF